MGLWDKPYPRRRGVAVAACAHGAACLSEREVRDDGSGWAPRVSDREEMSEGERRAGERALALGCEQAWGGLAGRGSGPAGQLASGPRGWVAAGPTGQHLRAFFKIKVFIFFFTIRKANKLSNNKKTI